MLPRRYPFYFFVVLIATLLISEALVTADAQTVPPPDTKLALKAALVVTPEFCATKFTKGSWATVKETFEVGKIACAELEPALQKVFSSLTSVTVAPSSGNAPSTDAQVVLTPRFVDVGAGVGVTAFSNREMDVFLEWTVKDASGKTVWIETVQGSSKHHMGNVFTHSKNLKLIVSDSVRDAAQQSAIKMSSAVELRSLTP
jgi:hypothetical protein